MKALLLALLVVVALMVVVVIGPLAVVLALNILFNLDIPFGFNQWLAVVIIYLFFNAASNTTVKVSK